MNSVALTLYVSLPSFSEVCRENRLAVPGLGFMRQTLVFGEASWAALAGAGVGPWHVWAVTFWGVLSRGLFAFLVFMLFIPRVEGNGCWTQLSGRCVAFWASMGSLYPGCPLEWLSPFQVALRQSGRMKFYL